VATNNNKNIFCKNDCISMSCKFKGYTLEEVERIR
jgi:hypothetical protein